MATTTAYPQQTAYPAHTPEAYVPYSYAAPAPVQPHVQTIPPTGIPAVPYQPVAHHAPAAAYVPAVAQPAVNVQAERAEQPQKTHRLRRFLIWTASIFVVVAAIAAVWMTRPDGGPHIVTNETQAIAEPVQTAPATTPATTPPTTAKPSKPTTTTPKTPTTVGKAGSTVPKK